MTNINIDFNPNDMSDPHNWALNRAPTFIGLDCAWVRDHTAYCVVSVHNIGGQNILAQREVKVFDQGTPSELVADTISRLATSYQAKVIIDATNDMAMVGTVSSRFGKEAPNRVVAAVITTALDDQLTPVAFPIYAGEKTLYIPRFNLSRQRSFQRLVQELQMKSIRLSKSGDAAILREQIGGIEMIEGGGRRGFDHPEGEHDDAVWSLALAVYGARMLAPATQRRSSGGARPAPSPAGWGTSRSQRY